MGQSQKCHLQLVTLPEVRLGGYLLITVHSYQARLHLLSMSSKPLVALRLSGQVSRDLSGAP